MALHAGGPGRLGGWLAGKSDISLTTTGVGECIELLTSFDGGYIHQGCWSWDGDIRRALPGLQGVGHGLQCKAEGQETRTVR